nr:helix-turn-helix domain-containing protein [Clostridia bacterium]
MPPLSFYERLRDFKTGDLIARQGPTIYPSHFHKCVEITYVMRGRCDFTINNESRTAYADDIIFASAYYPHSYSTSQDADRYTVLPESSLESDISDLMANMTFPCLLDDREFNRTKLLPVFDEAYEVQFSSEPSDQAVKWLMLKGFTDIIFGRFFERYGSRMIERNKQVNEIINILNYIEENCMNHLTLDELADRFGYNRYYFSKLFNSFIGDSLPNYINSTRIRRFVMLRKAMPDAKLLDLALSVGFESMPSFYRAFAKAFGCTPSEYFGGQR